MKVRIRSWARAAVLTAIAALLLPAIASAQTEKSPARPPSGFVGYLSRGAVIGFDILVARPLGFVATAVGAGAFIPAVIVTAPNGRDSVDSALEFFVLVPAKYVFQRPLGEF